MQNLENNIKRDYFYKFFTSFDITAGIWILYLSYKGMSLIEIGILESIFHITGLVFEIPTGAIADLIGRKKVIILGRICSVIASMIMLFSNSFLGFSIGFIVHAMSYNLNSGSEEALIYDSLKELGKEKEYISINGRINLIIEVAQGLAVFIGGALSEKSFSLSYVVAILIGLCSLGISFGFKETMMRSNGEKVSIGGHFKTCFKILISNKQLTKILVYLPLIFTFSTTTYFYGQKFFNEIGLSKFEISLIFLLNGIASSAGSILSEKFERKFNKESFILIPILIGASIFMFGVSSGYLSIFMFLLLGFLTAAMYPISSNKINSIIPSEQRATIISVDSMMFSLCMIVLFPIIGVIGQSFGLKIAFVIIGAITICSGIIASMFLKIK